MPTFLQRKTSSMSGGLRSRSGQSLARCLFSEWRGEAKSEGQLAKPSARSATDFGMGWWVNAPQIYLALQREHGNGSRTHGTTWANQMNGIRYKKKPFLGPGLQRQRLSTLPNLLSALAAMLWPDLGSRALMIEKALGSSSTNHRSVFLLMS